MSVHYKFKSALKYDTITFDGLHISVKDLKRDILQQKQIGKTGDFDLQITNAQTNEVYQDETTLIPKNSALIVVRVPLTAQQKRAWDRQEANQQLAGLKHVNPNLQLTYQEGQDPLVQKLAKAVDLSSLDASEDDKIAAMMTQSTLDYDPVNYARIRGTTQVGEVPANYRCFKCHQAGHWIKDCRLAGNQENQPEIRKSTGIPRSFMVPVEGPQVPGAMMTPSGQFAVPSIDHQAYMEGKKPSVPPEEMEPKPAIPEELVCSICHDLLTDTVMIPCCGSSFCDECIRTVLLESENHQCPDCKEIGISPDTMIPNRYLRKCVENFRNTTGYQRTQPSRSLSEHPGNSSLLPVPIVHNTIPIQNIQALGNNRGPAPEVINLIETPDNDSPQRLTSSRLPPIKPHPHSSNSVSSKGADLGRMATGDGRIQQPPHYTQPDRSATPTVDERTTLPDTSIPPPVNTYAITSTAYPPANYGGPPPPGYGGPPPNYPRVPLPYPNLGPGPAPNYPPVEPRGNMRQGYGRPYGRRGGNNRMHGAYHDRNERNNLPPGAIDDPLSAFEKILREKDKARERHRRRKRSFSRSPSPRPRSRTSRSRSPPIHSHRKRGSLSPTPPPVRQRSRSRSRTPSPPPRRHTPPSPVAHSRGARSRSLHRSQSKSRTPPLRREVRSRSRTPVKRRSPSFTISKSRSRSFSRTPSPRDRHFSPRRRDERFRSPLQGRNSPQRFHSRRRPPDEYEPQYYEGRRGGGRTRGYSRDPAYYTSPVRYDNRYDDRGRGYQQGAPRLEPISQPSRYGNRSNRYDNFGDTVPPGTEVVTGSYDQYPAEFTERRVVVVSSEKRDREREREREAAARDWERTRDRELETREKERLREFEEYHRGYRNTKSSSPRKARSHERGKENKRGEGEAIEAISLRDQNLDQYKNSEPTHTTLSTRGRVPVLVDLKKEPSMEREKKKEKEESTTPTKDKEKKKEKDKKKKRKEEGEKKEKKKKRKEKKDGSDKTKLEEKVLPVKVIEGKPIVVGVKGDLNPIDPLYGDIEGTTVDKEVVQNYGKVEQKSVEGETLEAANESVGEVKENVVLAPVPELSKWELEEDLPSQDDKISGDDGSNSAEKKIVTSEVLKRAENAIFQKAINAIRPIDIKKGAPPEKVPEKVKERKDSKDAPPKEQPSQEIVKISPDTTTSESREARKVANSIQITIPSHQSKAPERSVEIATTTISIDSSDSLKTRSLPEKSKVASVPVVPTSPVRKSAKERLGAKIDTDREEVRRVRSTVERKSRSRTPKRYLDRKYGEREKPREISPGGRRVVVSSSWTRDRDREENRRRAGESNKSMERKPEKTIDKEKDRRRDKRSRSSSRERKHKKELKTEKIIIRKRDEKPDERQVTVKVDQKKEVTEKKVRKNPKLASDRRKSSGLEEANFEPDYDETEPESEPEVPGEEKNLLVTLSHSPPSKKRSRSPSNDKEKKRLKSESEIEQTTEKISKEKDTEKSKKPDPETDESSDSDSSSESSSDTSVERKKRKKKKSKKRKKKKSRKRKDSSSESDTSESSSSDSDAGKKKKKHKHKKKSSKSKKRKKSKHK